MQYRSVVAAIAAATLAYAQDAPPNITDALASTEDLSTLNTLVGQYPDLVATLANATNITIFAPSNSALETAMGNELFTQLSEADMGFVMNLLTYHVINGTYMAANFSETPAFVRTLLTNETYTQVSGGQRVGLKTIGDEAAVLSGLGFRANVTQADVMIANGVVHIVDGILFPPLNASTTALAANLTALVGAVIATNLTEVVDTTPDITIFAPTTEAFEDIGSILANLSVEDAAALLQYHIINGTVAYSSLLANGTSVDSASGQPLNITIEDGEVFVNSARVIAADVLVANGVVHVIDAVLNPNSTLVADPDNDDGVPAFEGAEDGDVPYTSGIPAATGTPVVMTTDAVADGYTPAASDALSTAAEETAAQASETSSALAAKITGAVGAAALFGGAAFVAAL